MYQKNLHLNERNKFYYLQCMIIQIDEILKVHVIPLFDFLNLATIIKTKLICLETCPNNISIYLAEGWITLESFC